MSYVFDAGSILFLTRELGEKVLDAVKQNSTTSLAYYEIGNALWKELNLLKRLNFNEATKALKAIFSLLKLMKVVHIENADLGAKTLSEASKLDITYYDAAYLVTAKELGGVLVTDDKKLATASKKIGVETLSSKTFIQKEEPIWKRP